MDTSTQAITGRHAWPWRMAGLSAQPVWPRALGALAVLVFAMTMPMTRLAGGSLAEPHLPPLFVATARAALAGLLAGLYLWMVRAPRPRRHHAGCVAAVIVGGVLVFPMCMGWAVRAVPASHAAVIIGALPLCTAALAGWWLGQRPGRGFWWAAAAGGGLVLSYALWSARTRGGDHWVAADAWLVLAMLGASLTYVAGAVLSRQMPAAHVISWSLVIALPLTLPAAIWMWPHHSVPWSSWGALAYVAVGSTWLGFFAWYAALARDPMRVSQLQLMQPFLSIGMSCLILGERVDAVTLAFAAAVLGVVLIAQRRAASR